MITILIGVCIGLAAGVLAGIFGIGGGILIIPALVAAGLTQRVATGTSLAALLAPVGVLGMLQYAHRHEVRVWYAVGIAAGLTVGAYFGARFAGHVANVTLQRAFGVLLAAVSVKFLFFPR